jgi:hypothetical protein
MFLVSLGPLWQRYIPSSEGQMHPQQRLLDALTILLLALNPFRSDSVK